MVEANITQGEQPAGKYVEYVRTEEGELIPRGPIGKRTVVTTPKGTIINLNTEGLPVQRTKPEIVQVRVVDVPEGETVGIEAVGGPNVGLGIANGAVEEITRRVQEREKAGAYDQHPELTFSEKFEIEQAEIWAQDLKAIGSSNHDFSQLKQMPESVEYMGGMGYAVNQIRQRVH